jgi:hypothetical protein
VLREQADDTGDAVPLWPHMDYVVSSEAGVNSFLPEASCANLGKNASGTSPGISCDEQAHTDLLRLRNAC